MPTENAQVVFFFLSYFYLKLEKLLQDLIYNSSQAATIQTDHNAEIQATIRSENPIRIRAFWSDPDPDWSCFLDGSDQEPNSIKNIGCQFFLHIFLPIKTILINKC